MADDKPIIDFGTAQKDLQTLIDKLKIADTVILKISQDALTAGKNLSSITLPSDLANFTAENAKLTATIQAQAAALAKLQTQYNTLVQKRTQSSQKTAEESVNQSILNRNALEAARINSTLAGAYTKLSAEQSKAARTLQDLIARGRLSTQTQREYNKELRTAQKEFDELNKRVLAADKAVGRFNRNVGNYPMQAAKGLKDLLSAFGVVGGLQLFASIVKDIFATTKEIQSLDMALKQVTQTQALFAESQAFLSRISESYGVNINDLTKQFTQFYVSAKDKISGREIEQIFESITKAGASMGLSQQQQERAFMALNQMMSKGTIQAEELRGQLGEALPGAMGIMAKSLGVSEKGLAEMMKQGRLLAADVLPKFAKQLEITYGIEQVNRIETLTASQSRLSNSWIEFVRTLNESESGGITQFFSNILKGANWLLEGLVNINKSLKMIRTEFVNDATASQAEYLNAIKDTNEREKLSILTKKDAVVEIGKLNEKLAQLNHEFALLDEVKPLNFLPGRIARLKQVQREIEEVNASLGTQKGRLLGAQQVLDDMKKKDKPEEQAELTKAQLKAIEDRLKALYDSNKKELELRALRQEVILNGDLTTYDMQYAALEKFLDIKMQIIELDYNEQVRLAKGNADKIKSADLDMQMAVIKQSQDGYSKLKNVRKKQNDEYIQELKDIEDFLKKYHEDEDLRQEIAQEIEERSTKSTTDLIDKKIERLKELKKSTSEYLQSFGDEFASNSGFSETFNMFFKQIEGADGKMTTMFKQLLEGADTSEKKFAVVFNSIAESAQEAFNFISEASTKNFEGEKDRLQKQYDVNLKYAGDNKAAQEKLAEDLEKKKKDIDYREAKAKQKQALFNIAIDTAQAVISAVAESPLTFGLPWSAFALALGLAQAAAVSSQEIPRYFRGGTHDGGLMMVNDGSGSNYRETIVTPDGKVSKPTGRNVLMNAPAGTEIFTHDQWQNQMDNMLKGNGISWNIPNQYSSGLSKEDLEDVMIRTLASQSKQHNVWDRKGFGQYIEKGGNITRGNINRGNSQGIIFR